MTNIIPYQTKSFHIILEFYPPNLPEEYTFNFDISNPDSNITCNYDYQRTTAGFWDIYFDIGIKVQPIGFILYRTSFEFPLFMQDCDSIFSPETIEPLVNTALQCTIDHFKEISIEYEVEKPIDINIDDKIVQSFVNTIIEQYWTSRKADDQANSKMLFNIGLQCSSNDDTIVAFPKKRTVLN